ATVAGASPDPAPRAGDHQDPARQESSGKEFQDERSPVIAGTLRTPFDWERLLVDAAVIGGKDRWSRRLRGLENEFRRKLEEAEGAEHDESERAYLEKQLDHLKHLENFALPVIEFLGAIRAS